MLKSKRQKNCKTCGEPFRAYRSTDQYCSPACIPQEKKRGLERKSDQKIERRTRIKPVSKKQQRLNIRYLRARKAFLLNPKNRMCAVYPHQKATEVHHKMGRRGYADENARANDVPLIIDIRYFLAVSRDGHEWIERNPIQAKERGWSLDRLAKK